MEHGLLFLLLLLCSCLDVYPLNTFFLINCTTSVLHRQQVVFRQMSPHETMFAIRHTEQIEVHDIQHSAFCNFTIWDYPGGVYGRPLLPHEEELGYHDIDSNTHPHLASHPSMTRQPSVYDGHTAYSVPQQQQQQQYQHQQQYQQYPPNTTSAGGNANVDTSTNMLPSSPQLTLQSQSQFQNSSTLDTSTTPLPTTNNTDHYDETYSRASAIVFVLDANDEPYAESIQGLMDIIKRATRANPNIHIEVFLHRIDGELFVSDDSKYDCRREVKQQVTDELQDFQMEGVNISYHLTSIFDHSIREAFSKVVQKLVPHQETMQDLLNSFCLTTRMEKALLFDLQSKLYLCADHNPADPPMTELSAEMIEVAIDVSGIYGQEEEGTVGNDDDQTRGTDGTVQGQESIQEGRTTDTEEEQGSSLTSTVVEENGAATMATATHHDALLGTMVGNMSRNELAEDVKQDDLDDTADYVDADNICLITLQNGQVRAWLVVFGFLVLL